MDDCQIEKVVELSHEDFCHLKIVPSDSQPFIVENRSCMYSEDGVMHCLLALGQGSNDGVLIEAEGYRYPRYAAYIPGMRDIVNAEINRAAEFIVRQGTAESASVCWSVRFEELEKSLGLTIRESSGLDSMLRAALKQRPEVAAVDMHDGCIEMEYHPEYCQRLKKDDQPGLRLKELLPLLKGSGLIFLCHEEAERSVLMENLRLLTDAGQGDHAALLNARVAEICETPEGTEIVLTDVEPEELARFNEAVETFMAAEESMGPTMG
ncbi:DUF6329 domain-containing protein [Pseudoflavonifractor sp. 60]|uniref:DUF6329 domain-containing protein n=1 Tax=Pseudoflavonifractor sp. 60 TaxID=2304576 RepID=UPI001FADCCAB|nr:DUF6329 domain-containing protein [Pseudoflavonifractor sp. 60]